MFEDAIRYPWTGDERAKNVLIGGVLSILGAFLLLPIFVVYGYLVRVIRDASAGSVEEPPGFAEWPEMFVDGLKVFAVSLVYSLLPMLVFGLAMAAWVVPAAVSTGPGGSSETFVGLGFFAGLLLLFLGVAAMFVLLYLLPAGVAAFALTDDLSAALSPSTVREIATSGDYATGWLVAVGLTILANAVATAAAMTIVGIALLPFIGFYGNVAAAYAVGRGVEGLYLPENGL